VLPSEEINFSESLALNFFKLINQLKPCEARLQKTVQNVTLVARQREHFQGVLTIFLVPQLPPKEVF